MYTKFILSRLLKPKKIDVLRPLGSYTKKTTMDVLCLRPCCSTVRSSVLRAFEYEWAQKIKTIENKI